MLQRARFSFFTEAATYISPLTAVKPSKIEGNGTFATEDIKMGTTLIVEPLLLIGES